MHDTNATRPLIQRAFRPVIWVLDNAVVSLNAMGTLLIMAMMVLICADVFSRNLLGASLPGVIELAELGIVSLVYLQIADTLRRGKLMRSDVVIRTLELHVPRVGAALNAVFNATGAVLFFFITQGAYGRFTGAWTNGFYLGNQGSFTAPTWPMELCVAVGSGLMCLLFLANAVRNAAQFFGIDTGTPAVASSNEYDQ